MNFFFSHACYILSLLYSSHTGRGLPHLMPCRLAEGTTVSVESTTSIFRSQSKPSKQAAAPVNFYWLESVVVMRTSNLISWYSVRCRDYKALHYILFIHQIPIPNLFLKNFSLQCYLNVREIPAREEANLASYMTFLVFMYYIGG
jgi:hypothetical protein